MIDKKSQGLDVETILLLQQFIAKSRIHSLTLENAHTSLQLKQYASCDDRRFTQGSAESPHVACISALNVGVFTSRLDIENSASQTCLIQKGDLLGTIKVGLVLLPVMATETGYILSQKVKNGQCVEFGSELFEFSQRV